MARSNLKKPIVETDKPGGKAIKYWPSSKDAAAFYGFNQAIISYNINKINKQAKGHYFRLATTKEIASYGEILSMIDVVVEPTPVEPEIILPNVPVETIPEVVQKPENQGDALSPFNRLLQESKKKFNENS